MFRVIVQDTQRTPTSGKIVARLGSYDPHTKAVTLDKEKASFYLSHGAQPSGRVTILLKKEGVKLPKWVQAPDKKESVVRNPEKRRSTRPDEPAPAEEAPAAEAEVSEEATSEPAEPAKTESPESPESTKPEKTEEANDAKVGEEAETPSAQPEEETKDKPASEAEETETQEEPAVEEAKSDKEKA